MRQDRTRARTIEAAIGYAADAGGRGVAYARLAVPGGEQLLRVPFSVRRRRDLEDREVGYAALTALAGALRGRSVRRARFATEDAALVADINAHRDVPEAIVLPYVRLRCALNQFERFELRVDASGSDLAQRARAEVALHVAA